MDEQGGVMGESVENVALTSFQQRTRSKIKSGTTRLRERRVQTAMHVKMRIVLCRAIAVQLCLPFRRHDVISHAFQDGLQRMGGGYAKRSHDVPRQARCDDSCDFDCERRT